MTPQVRLISYTAPVIPGLNNSEDLIAFCARVSNEPNQMNTKTSGKLVQYLIRNKHWSPLEMVDITFEIKTTRDISRQILRHKSFSFQEFSQRYAEPVMVSEYRECRMQDFENRQNSISNASREFVEWWNKAQEDVMDLTDHLYKAAIEAGIAKEVARAILPEGLTVTTLYMKGSLRSWIHYLQLRKANGTQKEHQEIALLIMEEIQKLYPSVWEVLRGT